MIAKHLFTVFCGAFLHRLELMAQRPQTKGDWARPPGNSAEGIPDGVSWIIVSAFSALAFWLYSITPKKGRKTK